MDDLHDWYWDQVQLAVDEVDSAPEGRKSEALGLMAERYANMQDTKRVAAAICCSAQSGMVPDSSCIGPFDTPLAAVRAIAEHCYRADVWAVIRERDED